MLDQLEISKSRAQMKKLINLINILLLVQMCIYTNVLAVQAQMEEQKTFSKAEDGLDENQRTSSVLKNGSSASEIAPQIPAPPAVSLPEQASLQSNAKTVLNWRCRALALANEYPLSKSSTAWTLSVSYAKGQLLLKEAIMQTGLILQSEYDDAGQFLVSLPASNRKCDAIVIMQPVGETSTLFKMHVYADYHLDESKRINCLPETMKNLLENRGLWQ
jgi:hypothetical protein